MIQNRYLENGQGGGSSHPKQIKGGGSKRRK